MQLIDTVRGRTLTTIFLELKYINKWCLIKKCSRKISVENFKVTRWKRWEDVKFLWMNKPFHLLISPTEIIYKTTASISNNNIEERALHTLLFNLQHNPIRYILWSLFYKWKDWKLEILTIYLMSYT